MRWKTSQSGDSEIHELEIVPYVAALVYATREHVGRDMYLYTYEPVLQTYGKTIKAPTVSTRQEAEKIAIDMAKSHLAYVLGELEDMWSRY